MMFINYPSVVTFLYLFEISITFYFNCWLFFIFYKSLPIPTKKNTIYYILLGLIKYMAFFKFLNFFIKFFNVFVGLLIYWFSNYIILEPGTFLVSLQLIFTNYYFFVYTAVIYYFLAYYFIKGISPKNRVDNFLNFVSILFIFISSSFKLMSLNYPFSTYRYYPMNVINDDDGDPVNKKKKKSILVCYIIFELLILFLQLFIIFIFILFLSYFYVFSVFNLLLIDPYGVPFFRIIVFIIFIFIIFYNVFIVNIFLTLKLLIYYIQWFRIKKVKLLFYDFYLTNPLGLVNFYKYIKFIFNNNSQFDKNTRFVKVLYNTVVDKGSNNFYNFFKSYIFSILLKLNIYPPLSTYKKYNAGVYFFLENSNLISKKIESNIQELNFLAMIIPNPFISISIPLFNIFKLNSDMSSLNYYTIYYFYISFLCEYCKIFKANKNKLPKIFQKNIQTNKSFFLVYNFLPFVSFFSFHPYRLMFYKFYYSYYRFIFPVLCLLILLIFAFSLLPERVYQDIIFFEICQKLNKNLEPNFWQSFIFYKFYQDYNLFYFVKFCKSIPPVLLIISIFKFYFYHFLIGFFLRLETYFSLFFIIIIIKQFLNFDTYSKEDIKSSWWLTAYTKLIIYLFQKIINFYRLNYRKNNFYTKNPE